MPHIDFTNNAKNFNPLASVTLHAETEPDNASIANCQVSLNPVNGSKEPLCYGSGDGTGKWWNGLQPTILNNVFENAADDWYPISAPSFDVVEAGLCWNGLCKYEGMPGLGLTGQYDVPLENNQYIMRHQNVTIWGINPSDFVIPNFVGDNGRLHPGWNFLGTGGMPRDFNRPGTTTGRTSLFPWVYSDGTLAVSSFCNNREIFSWDYWYELGVPNSQYKATDTIIKHTILSPDPRLIDPISNEMFQTFAHNGHFPLQFDMMWEFSIIPLSWTERRMTIAVGQWTKPGGNDPNVEYGWYTKSPTRIDGSPLPTDPDWNNVSVLITMKNTVPHEYFRPHWKNAWSTVYPIDKTSSYFKLTHDPSQSFGPDPGCSDTLEIDFGL